VTAVYVLRHPETSWNLEQRYQGRLESPLSERGKEQASLASRAFLGEKLDVVYSSPLRRARDLGVLLADATGATLIVDQRLTEIAQCPWEGLTLSQIEQRFPAMYEQWYAGPESLTFPMGECLVDVQNRALSLMEDVMRRYPSGHVAVATHSVLIQTLVCAALSLDLKHVHRLRISNAGVSTFCGTAPPGSLLSLNVTDALFPSPVVGASAQDCVSWKARRLSA
jgi:broad specificity phosphatase PhoE